MLSIFKWIKKYLEIRYNIVRLDIAEKTILVLSHVLQVIIIVIFSSVIMIVLSFALANILGDYWDNTGLGLLVVAGIDILLLLLFIIFKDKLIIRPVSKKLIQHFAKIQEEEEHEDDDI